MSEPEKQNHVHHRAGYFKNTKKGKNIKTWTENEKALDTKIKQKNLDNSVTTLAIVTKT